MTREHIRSWFDSWIQRRRDSGIVIEVRAYQFEKLYEMITSPANAKYVLAAAPGAGKTLMSIMYIEYRIFTDHNYRMLVLTHGLSDLREQFIDSARYYNADFIHGNNVVIQLPHSVNVKRRDLGHIDEVIVDEAHQYYFADDGMIEAIIDKYGPTRQILLTGSPHPFILANQLKPGSFTISYIDAYTLWQLGVLQNVHVEVASTNYNFDFNKDFNQSGELLTSVHIPTARVTQAMSEMMDKIMARLLSRFKTDTELYKRYLENTIAENFILTRKAKNSIGKTMIACRNIPEANAVNRFLVEYGYDASQIVQSTSDVNRTMSRDETSLIKRFKAEPDIKFLIVVYNGILGFDFTELCNIIDLTCSRNVSRIHQLYSRLVRKSGEKMDKFYYKVVPYDLVYFYEEFMEGTLHLSHEHFLSQFNGKNFLELEIVHKKRRVIAPIKKDDVVEDKQVTTGGGRYIPRVMSMESVFEMIKLSHTGNAAIDSKSYTTMRHVMHSMGIAVKMNFKNMNDAQLLEMANDVLTKKR